METNEITNTPEHFYVGKQFKRGNLPLVIKGVTKVSMKRTYKSFQIGLEFSRSQNPQYKFS